MFGRFAPLFVAVALFSGAASAEPFPRGPAPAWVIDLPLPETVRRHPRDTGGLHEVLTDEQIAWEDGAEVSYRRMVLAPVTRAGVEEAATVQLDYDPGAEEVQLVALRRWRGGVALDLTGSVQPEVMRRETGLDVGILDGSLTAVFQVPDVKVGDLVEVAWVTRHRDYIAGLPLAVALRLQTELPSDRVHLAVHWPKGRALHRAPVPPVPGLVATETEEPGGTLLQWTLTDDPGVTLEEHTAIEARPFAEVALSEAGDWASLVAAVAPFYTGTEPLTPDWEARLTEIAKAEPTPEGRALAVLRLVQDEIRYVSLSMGAGGYVARRPAEVIATGFGDCKDKALLTRASLGFLGIASDVALTDLDEGRALPLGPRAVWVFDHAILRIRIGGAVYWVDPTLTLQGGSLATQAAPEVFWALPLTEEPQPQLQEVPIDPETQAVNEVKESIAVGRMGLYLRVEVRRLGRVADEQRAWMAGESDETVLDDMMSWYLETFPGLELAGDLRVKDDRATGELVLIAEARVAPNKEDIDAILANLRIEAPNFAREFPEDLAAPRRWDMGLSAPLAYHQTTWLQVFDQDLSAQDPAEVNSSAFDYRYAWRRDQGGLRLDWDYVRHLGPVSAGHVAGLAGPIDKMSETLSQTWDLSN